MHHLEKILLHRQDELCFLPNEFRFKDVSRSESISCDLVLICRSDTFFGGSDRILASVDLLGTIQFLVVVLNEMCSVGYPESIDGKAGISNLFDLLGHVIHVDNDAVADDRQFAFSKDSRWKKVQFEDVVTDDYRVTCVVPALETDDCIRILCKIICDFPFAFIAPLGPDNSKRRHVKNVR